MVYLYFSRSAGSIGARSAPSTPFQVSPGAQQAGQQSISGSQLTVTSANNSQPPRSPSHATLRCNDRWVHDLSASHFHLPRVNRSYYDSYNSICRNQHWKIFYFIWCSCIISQQISVGNFKFLAVKLDQLSYDRFN